jgi:hypothetical protein
MMPRKVPSANPESVAALSYARKRWGMAIRRVDSHSRLCRPCNRQRHPHAFAVLSGALTNPGVEAYQLCPKARELYEEERQALADYRALGGTLPVVREGARA